MLLSHFKQDTKTYLHRRRVLRVLHSADACFHLRRLLPSALAVRGREVCGGVHSPFVALALLAALGLRQLDEARVEAEVVANGVLPALVLLTLEELVTGRQI